MILVDTSILIDLFRKTDKANAALISLVKKGYTYSLGAIIPKSKRDEVRYL